jgi:hypothetical protein
MLAIGPGNFLDYDAAGFAVDPAHAVEEKNQEAPNGDELERTLGRADCSRPQAGGNRNRWFWNPHVAAPGSPGACDLR